MVNENQNITIAQLRGLCGFNIKECAEFLNITPKAYAEKEKGISPFKFTEVKALCDKAGRSMDRIDIAPRTD
jgi:DNA-binding XRE family transcriptional regulator